MEKVYYILRRYYSLLLCVYLFSDAPYLIALLFHHVQPHQHSTPSMQFIVFCVVIHSAVFVAAVGAVAIFYTPSRRQLHFVLATILRRFPVLTLFDASNSIVLCIPRTDLKARSSSSPRICRKYEWWMQITLCHHISTKANATTYSSCFGSMHALYILQYSPAPFHGAWRTTKLEKKSRRFLHCLPMHNWIFSGSFFYALFWSLHLPFIIIDNCTVHTEIEGDTQTRI